MSKRSSTSRKAARAHTRTPTFGLAERLLGDAAERLDAADLEKSKVKKETIRIAAADLVWLAIRTAGQRVLYCAGQSDWYKMREIEDRVREAEVARNGPATIAAELGLAEHDQHGGCAYGADERHCDPAKLRVKIQAVQNAIRFARPAWDAPGGACYRH